MGCTRSAKQSFRNLPHQARLIELGFLHQVHQVRASQYCKMSWDPQIASITNAGFQASIYALDTGAAYTTDQLKMTPVQVRDAEKAIKDGAAGKAKVSVGEKSFMVLRNDEDMCYFKCKGQGGGAFGKTKTLLVAGILEEGQQAGMLNDLLGKVVSHLKDSGY